MNQSFLAVLGKLVFAAAGVAIAAAAPKTANAFTPQVEQPLLAQQTTPRSRPAQTQPPRRPAGQTTPRSRPAQTQPSRPRPAQTPTRRPPVQTNLQVPEPIASAVLENLSQQTGVPLSSLRVVEAQQKTWSDGCLGLGSPGLTCAQGLVPGWQVLVASDRQRWVYRTNLTGTLVKLDAPATQALSQGSILPATTVPPVTRATPTETLPPLLPRNRIQTPLSETVPQGQGDFSLAIRQPAGTLADVVARVSLKPRRGDGYGPEQFVGDFRYRSNQRARFQRGMNAGDRVVVRLYNFQNRLIGYSEFELLPENAAVNLILGNQPTQTRVVRTVYGVDADANGIIDTNQEVYDYFTQISGTTPAQEQVTFLDSPQQINLTWFQVVGLPVPPQTSVYPRSLSTGVAIQAMRVFAPDLPAVLTAAPGREGRIVLLGPGNTSIYDVSQLLAVAQPPVRPPAQRPVPLPEQPEPTPPPVPEVQVTFPDVPDNHWARGFIGQLVARELIQGYPDGLYRPNEPVTRAELATIISKAFDRNKTREMVNFRDVPTNHWAYPAIRDAYEMGFLGTPSGRVFNPDQRVSRLDVLMALTRGLRYAPSGSVDRVLRVYRDAASIPADDRRAIAAATERRLVVNYPNARFLNLRRVATRAEIAALIYQALVSTGQATAIPSPYVVGTNVPANEAPPRERPRQTPARRRPTSTQPVRQMTPVRRTTPQPRMRQTAPTQRTQPRVRQTAPVQRVNTQQRIRQTAPAQRTQPRVRQTPVRGGDR
jgi:S-layer homology domain